MDNVNVNADSSVVVEGDNDITTNRKRLVVVGLGMVALGEDNTNFSHSFFRVELTNPGFIEKVIKLDAKRRQYDIVVIGEEPHPAYNRVSLSSFFEHRNVENLYLNPKEWDALADRFGPWKYTSFEPGSLSYHLNTTVTEIVPEKKLVKTCSGNCISYDTLVLAIGSDAILPTRIPGSDANGVFVYRTISDLERLIEFGSKHQGDVGITIGGGLLGLEAAKGMMDMGAFRSVKVIEMCRWVLARQLDGDAGSLVTEKIRDLGLDVLLRKQVSRINVNDDNNVVGITFADGEIIDCSCICFAVGVRPRDELARTSGVKCAERGGIVINELLETSMPDVFAIGDCASWENMTFGIIAPGIEMADVLSFNLTRTTEQTPKYFNRPDLSTKLKLLGVEVASFGDFFADRDGPKSLPMNLKLPLRQNSTNDAVDDESPSPSVKALTYKDPFGPIYKKYLFTTDGRFLLGGMMIGDTKDYAKLNQMVRSQKPLESQPSEFILGIQKDGAGDVDDLDDDTQICSCHNVLKCDIVENIENGNCKTIGDLKSCTKAGTGCGGCVPIVQSILNKTMNEMGQEVSDHLCSHFPYSRADLYNIIAVKRLKTLEDVMNICGKHPNSLGCEICKPAVGSILASLFNQHVLDANVHSLQDTNDRFLANIQRNGSYSVIPRIPGGEITPDKLMAISQVAKKYNLYCKITGGQRIDMFGARKNDLLDIWGELVSSGLESGHAYAKALRTVKSCVGTTWCRFGVGDSVGMAIRIENRYKGIRSPHKVKAAVSGCVRECAEAQNKDFGLIATEKGYNLFVGGNGGAKPRHAELLAKDVPPEDIISLIDRYLIFYIRTADRLERTARWIEKLPGGIKYLKEVIMDDKLGICADLEKQMEELVGSYFCEWAEALESPERQRFFKQFGNTEEQIENVEIVKERDQQRPANWPQDSATQDFRGHKWETVSWQPVIRANHFGDGPPAISSANVKRGNTQLAVFKIKGKFYATQQMCPHRRAFVLSDGLVGDDDRGKYWVSCPYHKRNFDLNGEQAGRCSSDEGLSIATFPAEEREDGWVYLKLPGVEELDSVLGTEKWRVKKEESQDPFEKVDKRYKGLRGKKIGECGVAVLEREIVLDGIDW